MPTTAMTSDQFTKLWNRKTKHDLVLYRAIKRTYGTSLYKWKNVVGFGIGRKKSKPIVLVYVKRKTSSSKLKPKDRIPRSLRIGKKRIETSILVTGEFSLAANPVLGDPGDDNNGNRKSYHSDGDGNWEMGTKITIWTGCKKGVSASTMKAVTDMVGVSYGTSGARVFHPKTDTAPSFMLTCSHVLQDDTTDVAQCKENRVDPCSAPPKDCLKNNVGHSVKVEDMKKADAGIAECALPFMQRTILHIGEYRPPAEPRVDLYVMKSGATTGLTFSKIVSTTGEIKDEKLNVKLPGAFLIDNRCVDDPALPAAKYGDPSKDANVKPTFAKNKFAWKGDSGSLIVVGRNPETSEIAVEKSEVDYELHLQTDKNERYKTLMKYHKAALGLLCAISITAEGGVVRYPYAVGQRIQLAIDALDFKLDCET